MGGILGNPRGATSGCGISHTEKTLPQFLFCGAQNITEVLGLEHCIVAVGLEEEVGVWLETEVAGGAGLLPLPQHSKLPLDPLLGL